MQRADRKLVSLAIHVLALVISICSANAAFAQACPRQSSGGPSSASQVRTLEGRLIFHDGIRGWFELKLDKPECGQHSIQLMEFTENSDALEVFRGCRVRSTGAIDYSPTGYYTLDVFQDAKTIEPVGPCVRQSPFPDYTKAKPDKHIRAYRVDMHIIYGRGDHPVEFRVRSGSRELHPWQAYASYWLTGGFVLYGHCGEGFAVDRVFGTQEARPGHFDDPGAPGDMADFDPESAAAVGKWDLHLCYTCIRVSLQDHRGL